MSGREDKQNGNGNVLGILHTLLCCSLTVRTGKVAEIQKENINIYIVITTKLKKAKLP